jgi:hypothetical protein
VTGIIRTPGTDSAGAAAPADPGRVHCPGQLSGPGSAGGARHWARAAAAVTVRVVVRPRGPWRVTVSGGLTCSTRNLPVKSTSRAAPGRLAGRRVRRAAAAHPSRQAVTVRATDRWHAAPWPGGYQLANLIIIISRPFVQH